MMKFLGLLVTAALLATAILFSGCGDEPTYMRYPIDAIDGGTD